MRKTKHLAASPDFKIENTGPVSEAFLERKITSFKQAADFVLQLPYRRNTDKNNLLTVFSDACGTCSTKHALLKQLGVENNFTELHLMLGIFKMDGGNTPEILNTLRKNNIDYIPEAHNYLRYNGVLLDFTKPGFKLSADETDLLAELELNPDQIGDYKILFHKNFLKSWLETNPEFTISPEKLWEVREQCIADLAAGSR